MTPTRKKIVYIAHPISGDVRRNLDKIAAIYRELSMNGEVIPFAPYFVSIAAFDDSVHAERELGMSHNTVLFERGIIDELWVYGISRGVIAEMDLALEHGVEIRMKVEVEV